MDRILLERGRQLRRELKRIARILIEKYKPEKIFLFGSLVNGNLSETSDIDLFIVKNTSKRYWERIDEVLHSIHPREAIDIFVFTQKEIEDNLKKNVYLKEIIEKGRLIYERTK